jgi:hypothetical protein
VTCVNLLYGVVDETIWAMHAQHNSLAMFIHVLFGCIIAAIRCDNVQVLASINQVILIQIIIVVEFLDLV